MKEVYKWSLARWNDTRELDDVIKSYSFHFAEIIPTIFDNNSLLK